MSPRLLWFVLFCAAHVALTTACGPKRVSRGPSAQELDWQRAHELEERGQTKKALAAYRSVCESGYDRGCLTEIRLLFDLDEKDAASERVFLFFVRHPMSGHGSSVVNETARFFVRHDRLEEGWELLGRLAEMTKGLGAHDAVLYQRAFLARSMDEPLRERAALERFVALYGRWDSGLWDDAVWRLVQMAEARGDEKEQERWLTVLIEAKETSLIIGSYDSPYHDNALMLLGRLRARRGDLKAALKLFYELAQTDKSRLRDDALVQAMRFAARAAAFEEACHAARRLLREEPKSRFVPEARRFMSEKACEP